MCHTPAHPMADKTPIVARTMAIFLCAIFGAASAFGQELTIEDVEQRAQTISIVEGLLSERQLALESDAALDLRFAPGQLQYGHEQVFGDDIVGYLQGTVVYEQPFDLVSWRPDARRATSLRSSALRAGQSAVLRDTTTAARSAFYQALYIQLRIAVLESWESRLLQALERATVLQTRGEIAPLDVMRLQQQATLVDTRLALEGASLTAAEFELAEVLRLESLPMVTGTLLPDPVESGVLRDTPEVIGLTASLEALDAERAANRSPYLREWVLAGGFRFSQVANSFGQGVVLSLTVPLDTRNSQRLVHQRIEAISELQSREVERARQIQSAAVMRAAARYQRAMETLLSLRDAQDSALPDVADSARDAGEITLTEWLDIQENEAEIQLGLLALQYESRRSAIELAHLNFQGEIE
jgi:outer membrane protein TolC